MTTKETPTSESVNFYTHGSGNTRRAHVWRYLGKGAQAYMCMECELRVTKFALKEATDA